MLRSSLDLFGKYARPTEEDTNAARIALKEAHLLMTEREGYAKPMVIMTTASTHLTIMVIGQAGTLRKQFVECVAEMLPDMHVVLEGGPGHDAQLLTTAKEENAPVVMVYIITTVPAQEQEDARLMPVRRIVPSETLPEV